MTDKVGMMSSYDNLTGVIVRFDESIYMVSPIDSPMITGVQSDGLSVTTMEGGLDQIAWTWQDETLLTPRSLIAGAVATADTYITVTTGDQTKFSTGMQLRVIEATGSEIMRVVGYGVTAHTLLVTRAFAGTTARDFATNDRVRGMGTALPEGSAAENARSKDRDPFSNNTQIFGPERVSITETDRHIRRYGVSDEFAHQLYNRTIEKNIEREYAALYGVQYNSTVDRVRTTGGFFSYCTTNVDSTSTQLTVTSISAAQQLCYNKGKIPGILMANPVALSDLNEITDTGRVRVEMVDSRRGRARVETVTTEFGDVVIARNRWLEASDAGLWNRENAKREVMRPMQFRMLPIDGDSQTGHLVGEEGWTWKGMKHCAKFTALGYTAVTGY